MSKKNLLNEATIRRFMKLAELEPLASPFVGRLSEMNPYGGNKGDELEHTSPGRGERKGDEAYVNEEDDDESMGDPSETHPGELD